jgi:hypothetical protein
MIGFLGLMLVLGGVASLGSYWISWEGGDAKSRPPFSVKLRSDVAQLIRRRAEAIAARRLRSSAVPSRETRAPESAA